MIKSARATVASSAVLLLVLMTGMITPTIGTASAANSIDKVQSGLVTSDSLTTGNTASWTFGGTANLHNYYEDSQGLHIGIQAPQKDQWVNYYAYSFQPKAYLFHAVVTIPDTSVADGVSNVGLYVEGSDFTAHVGCETYADLSGYYWIVEKSSDAGATYTILYSSPVSSMPQTQDCTIITNGNNYLKVYIGGNVVFSSTTMSLGMPAPLVAYFQNDASSSSSMHYATYFDYYSTTDEKIKVTNNPSNAATAKVVDSSGNVLASAQVSAGTAILDIGKYHFPLSATINVYDSNNSIIASSPASIYGGDVFSVTSSSGTPTVPQPPTGLTATVVSSSQINLSWSAPTDNGGSPVTNYRIFRSTSSGTEAFLTKIGDVTSYTDTGLTGGVTYFYKVKAVNAVDSFGSSFSNEASATTLPNATSTKSIALITSGLVAFDPLNNETKTRQELESDQSYWNYGGSAAGFNPPAPTDLFSDSQGLHIGVQAPYANGTYAGYYAVTPPTNAKLFHGVISTPHRTTSSHFFQNGAYVQTGPQDGRINYVTCVSITSTAGTSWHIVRTFGNFNQATEFEVLWSDFSANQPLTKDCTIITNGNNYLKIYLDGIKVYENSTLNLQIPAPFLYFLEPQNSHAKMLYGIYRDFYITSDENIRVTNVPATATRVDVVGTTGNVLASAQVSAGTAMLDIGKYHMPLAVNIKVYDSNNMIIASTSTPVSMFGGDVYSVS